VAPVVIIIPVRMLEGKVCTGIDIMLYAVVSCDFICSTAIKQLILLPEGKTISINPCAVNSLERFM
jgi:hypothetical protein